MKKIIELEDRWKTYKYKAYIFYLFVFVFVVFVALLVFFIKLQYDRVSKSKTLTTNKQVVSNNNVSKNVAFNDKNILEERTPAAPKQVDKINFICKQVIVDKLAVRAAASFNSTAIGYYGLDSIFCAKNENVNGLIKTTNGWVSSSDKFSKIVDVNMFVDSGFYKYQNLATKNVKPKTTDFEEVKVFDKPQNVKSNNAPTRLANENTTNNYPLATQQTSKPKPVISINTTKLTKETIIDFKKSDFRNTNDYNTAIEIANFYYQQKDYQNSIKWALNASNADSKGKQKVESWIIYAKSLYASGKKDEALDVLSKYVATTSSQDAIDALNNMKRGII